MSRSHTAARRKEPLGRWFVRPGFEIGRAVLETPRLDEASYRAFFVGAVEGIFRTTPDGRYLAANPALARLYGYDTPEQLVAELTDIASCLYIDPRRREAFTASLKATDQVTNFESEIRRRDGTTLWIVENARAVRSREGRLLHYEGTVEDITPRREAEQRLREALSRAEAANRAKSAFLATMSHELKTPLNAIIGFGQLIENESLGALGDPQYRDYAAYVTESGQHLLQIISSILDLSRLECGEEKIDDEIVSVPELIENATNGFVSGCRPEVGSALLHLDLPAGLPFVRVDFRKIRQILRNVLSNAVKFTAADGRVTITGELRRDGTLAIHVIDTGIGMAPENIRMALEPFAQIDSRFARDFEGLGLGLSVARALAELHGGRLEIESTLGEGTRVSLILPSNRVIQSSERSR